MRHDLLVDRRLDDVEQEDSHGLVAEQGIGLVAVVDQRDLGGGAQGDEEDRGRQPDLCHDEADDMVRRGIEVRPVDHVELDGRPVVGGVVEDGRNEADDAQGCGDIGAGARPQLPPLTVDQHEQDDGQARHQEAEVDQLAEAGAYACPDPPLAVVGGHGADQAAAHDDQQQLQRAFGIEDGAVERRRRQQ